MPWCSRARKVVFKTIHKVINNSNNGSLTTSYKLFWNDSQVSYLKQQWTQHSQFRSSGRSSGINQIKNVKIIGQDINRLLEYRLHKLCKLVGFCSVVTVYDYE